MENLRHKQWSIPHTLVLAFTGFMASGLIQAQQRSDFDNYVGMYEIISSFIVTITRDDGILFAQATGQKKFQLLPQSEHRFVYKDSNQSLIFNIGDGGVVQSITQKVDRFSRIALKQSAPPQ